MLSMHARFTGNGVKDLFYEPYQGAIHSPEGFVQGVGQGTKMFFKGLVTGTLTSTAAIIGKLYYSMCVCVYDSMCTNLSVSMYVLGCAGMSLRV
jgi:Vacuolar-sorting-associated 13 protein C-terminal